MREVPFVVLTSEMIDDATRLVPAAKVHRTTASKIDTLTGYLGELAFAQYFFGDWQRHRVGQNKGEADFPDIEVKTSAFPFRETLNLLVREDYAKKRKPPFYVQVIVAVDSPKADRIKPGTLAHICGYASADAVDRSPLKDFGSKFGGRGGYRCHYIMIRDLHPIEEFNEAYRRHRVSQGRTE